MSEEKKTEEVKNEGGRPLEYNDEIIKKAQAYIDSCEDKEIEKGTEERPTYLLKVKLPTKGGLAFYLGVARDTLYDWASKYPKFSDIMEQLGALQEERLIDNGLSGDYNPTIAKVLLTKHGYREGIEQTGKDGSPLIPDKETQSKVNQAIATLLNGKGTNN